MFLSSVISADSMGTCQPVKVEARLSRSALAEKIEDSLIELESMQTMMM